MNRRYRRPPTPPATAEPREPPEATAAEVSEMLGMVEVSGEGFLPGEGVAVAVAVVGWHTSAGPHGHARALVGTVKLGATSEAILFGRVSGTTTVVHGVP